MKNNVWAEVDLDELVVRGCEPPKEEFHEDSSAEQDAPLTSAQRALLKDLDDSGVKKHNCFGGVLLQRTDADNKPILSFVVADMTDREAAKMKAEYKELFRSGLQGMIYGADPFMERFKEYTVFNFLHNTTRISLRDYCERKGDRIPAEQMLRKLLKPLVDYFNCSTEGYKSLNCFSLDTIFLDSLGGMWLLPLRAFRNCFPCEIAPEAHDPNQTCDVRSDLYAAAYVAMEVANGGTLCDMEYLEDSVFKDCLLGVHQCRPSLHRVTKLFRGSGSESRTTAEEASFRIPVAASQKKEKKPSLNYTSILEKLRKLWEAFLEWLRKCLFVEPEKQLRGTLEDGKKSVFRRIKPIQDSDEEDAV